MEDVDYTDTFITVAPDSPAVSGAQPLGETIAALSYRLIAEHPYELRSSDVIFGVWAIRNDIPAAEQQDAWREFYAKPRACLRSSDLGKRWGWGIHADAAGRVCLYAVDSSEYRQLAAGVAPDGRTTTVRAALRCRR